MPARPSPSGTILLIDRTDSGSPVREIHSGPRRARAAGMRAAVGQPFPQRGARGRLSGTTRRRSPLPWRITSSPVRCVRRTSSTSSVGELADPHAGQHQQLHDRPVAAGRQPIGLALQRAQLLARERPRRPRVDLDAPHRRRRAAPASPAATSRPPARGSPSTAPAADRPAAGASPPAARVDRRRRRGARNASSSSPATRCSTSSRTHRRYAARVRARAPGAGASRRSRRAPARRPTRGSCRNHRTADSRRARPRCAPPRTWDSGNARP